MKDPIGNFLDWCLRGAAAWWFMATTYNWIEVDTGVKPVVYVLVIIALRIPNKWYGWRE